MDLKFDVSIAFDNISDKFEGQGQMSRSTFRKNMIFGLFDDVACGVCCSKMVKSNLHEPDSVLRN